MQSGTRDRPSRSQKTAGRESSARAGQTQARCHPGRNQETSRSNQATGATQGRARGRRLDESFNEIKKLQALSQRLEQIKTQSESAVQLETKKSQALAQQLENSKSEREASLVEIEKLRA